MVWVIRDKDDSAGLAREMGLDFETLSVARTGMFGNAAELLLNIPRAIRISKRYGIDLWFTKYGAANVAARLMHRKNVSFNDDDIDVVPYIAYTSYPFADRVFAPDNVRMGRFAPKVDRYPGFHELFYLHPQRFRPDATVREELGLARDKQYGILRLSGLQAHHDVGIEGMGWSLVRRVIQEFGQRFKIFITSERTLAAEFEPYRIALPRTRIHHALAFADFFAGDSQTMAAEAAVLGTPAFRINDFVGRITYLSDLESFGLAYGFHRNQEEEFIRCMGDVLREPRRREQFEQRRREMLARKIDPVPYVAGRLREVLESQ